MTVNDAFVAQAWAESAGAVGKACAAHLLGALMMSARGNIQKIDLKVGSASPTGDVPDCGARRCMCWRTRTWS